jgi:predicted nucleic acid-binding protein
MARLALDTTFLIDLQRERRGRASARPATTFLLAHQDTELLLPAVALGEYLEGFADPDSRDARALVAPLRLLEVTADVARSYAVTVRALRATGRLIGTNDLWIGCTARAAGLPILTRDVAHFRRIAGLEVVGY